MGYLKVQEILIMFPRISYLGTKVVDVRSVGIERLPTEKRGGPVDPLTRGEPSYPQFNG